MNSSILRCSLGVTQSSALNEPEAVSPRGTWPAIFAGRSDTSKLWIAPMPDCPPIKRFHTASAPTPSGVTRPMPVTTIRFMLACFGPPRGGNNSLMRLDEVHGVLDGDNLLGGIVGNLAAEFLFERHHQLDGVEAVGSEIVDEAGILGHLGLVDAKMLHDDLFHSLGDIAHRFIPSTENALCGLKLSGLDAPGRARRRQVPHART